MKNSEIAAWIKQDIQDEEIRRILKVEVSTAGRGEQLMVDLSSNFLNKQCMGCRERGNLKILSV